MVLEAKMNLPFKEFLLRKTKELGIKFYENEIYRYAEELNEVDFVKTSDDIAVCYANIRYCDDSHYCGEGTSNRAKYYLMDEQHNLYWFASARDAVLFACPESKAVVGTMVDVTSIFHKYRRYFYEGYYFLYADDLYDLETILSQQRGYICVDKNLRFNTEEDIIMWLVNSGIASNAANARRQLTKHLMGQTNACYKLRFKKI